MKRLIPFLLFLGSLCYGQAVRVDQPLLTSGPNVPVPGGALAQTLWYSNASVYICAHPAVSLVACQNSLITTYTESTMTVPCTTGQIVNLPGNTCSLSAGSTANVGFWYTGGIVDYWITSPYGTSGPYTISAAASSAALLPVTPEQYGAKHDDLEVTDANCTAGSTTITTTTSTPFTSTLVDAGKTIVVNGCGALNTRQGNLSGLVPTAFTSTISSVINSQTAVMASAPPSNAGTVTSVTYVSGVTATGVLAQNCIITLPKGGTVSLAMTGTNTFTSGTTLQVLTLDLGESVPPTTGTVSNGSATACSGTPVLTSTLAPAGWSNQWMNFGTNDHDAINSCIQNGTVKGGACHLADGNHYMVSTPASGPHAGSGTLPISAAGGVYNGIIDGNATLVFAPTSPFTGGTNDRLFSISSSLATCPSGAYSVCPITGAIANGANTFTAVNASDVSSLTAGQWLIMQELYSAGQTSYVDWVQVAGVSGATVTTVQPFRMAFPCTEPIVPGVTGCGFRVVSNITNNVTFRDFSIEVPNLFDSVAGRAAVGIASTAAVGTTFDNIKCANAAQNCYADQFTRGLTLINVEWTSEFQASEFASDVDLKITSGSIFAKKAAAINQYRDACSAGSSASGINLDEGTGFYAITGINIPEACGIGISTLQGVHDGAISDSNIGWIECQSSNCYFNANAVQHIGGYRNSVHDNTFSGASSIAGTGIFFANSGSPAITSASNSASNNKCNTVTTDFQGGCYIASGPTDTVSTPNGATSQVLTTAVPVLGQNTASQVVYALLGKPTANSVEDSYGTRFSSGGPFLSFNASPNATGSDSWQAYNSSTPTTALTMDNVTGLGYWGATAGTCPTGGANSFSTCFGATPVFKCTTNGQCTAALGLISSAGVTATTGLTDSAVTSACSLNTTAGGLIQPNTCTGTGNTVRATSPTLTTPVLGAATGTSLDMSGASGGLKIKDQGTCTMAAGTCAAQSLGHTYATTAVCFATWNGSGTMTGIMKAASTTTTVTPASSVGTDTAVVNWFCLGN